MRNVATLAENGVFVENAFCDFKKLIVETESRVSRSLIRSEINASVYNFVWKLGWVAKLFHYMVVTVNV